MTFYKGLMMNSDINWDTKEITNLQEPVFTRAFTNSLKKSSVSAHVKSLKTAKGTIIDPGASRELGAAGPAVSLK